jgi:hypothetical protein
MSGQICLVVPEAPMLQTGTAGEHHALDRANLRLGVLDNSKGNADHLLRFVVDGIKSAMPVKSVVSLRKPTSGRAASDEILARLASETDFVVSAMAD